MESRQNAPASERSSLGRTIARRLVLAGVVAFAIAFAGIVSREKSEADLVQETHTLAIPTVDVIAPERGAGRQELVLPGQIEAWYSAPLYARVSGYVKMWYKDIGAKVHAGDLLAEIDTPDLDQQYEEAKSQLARAQADEALAELTAKRWEAMRASQAVSQQTADEKVGDLEAKRADVAAAKANVARLEALEGFKKIIAPFDGVVTARKIDVGALVNSTPTNAPDLFDVSDVHALRIYVKVPQAFAARLRGGMTARIKVPQYPDRTFDATLATTSEAISQESRSLLVELHYDNKDGLLQPGSFVEVHFDLPADGNTLRLPASALIFRKNKPEVATVGMDDKITLKPISVSRDLGTEIEVQSGLAPSDHVVRSPWDSIADGDSVRIAGQDKTASEVSAR